jgi:hypothetical protein
MCIEQRETAMTDLQELCKVEDELEALIDKYGLRNIAISLTIVCNSKSQHIEENWQDRGLARQWRNAAKAFDVAWSKITV